MSIPKRPRKCRVCRNDFQPVRCLQQTCSFDCEVKLGMIHAERSKLKREKAERIAMQESRKTIRVKLEKLKTLSKLLKEAQVAFNAWVRERDKSLPCVSCGRFHTGAYDAGHYRSVGAAPSLRFDPANVHRQCVPCNQHKSGNVLEYRLGLISRIGLNEVERIEGPLPDVKWTKEQAREIKSHYVAKLKELKNGN